MRSLIVMASVAVVALTACGEGTPVPPAGATAGTSSGQAGFGSAGAGGNASGAGGKEPTAGSSGTGATPVAGQGGMAGNGGSAPETTRPNIIFVLVDDLGWGDLGVFYQNERAGGQKHQTPQLDQLAAEGLQMRRHYTPAPVCAPARASLLLGVHQGHANVRDNQFDKTLEDNHTLGNVLQRAGYATANIGKYGLQGPGAPAAQPSRPGLRGFDYFFGYLSHKAAHNHYPALLQGMDDQGQPNAFFEGTTDIRSELAKSYSTDLFTARAKKWIVDQHTARPEQPFFLYLAYTAPHSQLQLPTDSHLTATSNYPKGGGLEGGVQWQGKAGAMINTATGAVDAGMHPDYASKGWPDSAKRHATLVRRLDDAMADLITLLKDLSIDEETLIVFTSDNGPTNESRDPQFFRSYGPFEGIKRDVLEGGIRVPTLVRWPSHVPAGGVSHAPSQFHDWMPTFAELAGVPQPARSDGVSLVPTLTGQGTQPESTVYVEYQYAGKTPSYADFANHAGDQRQQMQVILSGGYKALRTSIASGTTPFRLYDPEEDPGEGMDLFGANGAPTAAQIMTRVATVRRPNASAPRPYDAVQLPAEAHATSPGLSFRAFEQQTPWVPNWSTFSPAGQGEAPELDLSVRTRDDDIGLLFTGYLDVPSAGEYTFFLRTDTGAFVRLHDAQLLDADYGYEGGSEVSSGAIALDAGLHPITIHYRHGTTAEHALSLAWQGPGMAKEPVPSSAWLH